MKYLMRALSLCAVLVVLQGQVSSAMIPVNSGLNNAPDLIYDRPMGKVMIYPTGPVILSFDLQSAGQFLPPADFTHLDNDVGVPKYYGRQHAQYHQLDERAGFERYRLRRPRRLGQYAHRRSGPHLAEMA